MNRIVSALIVFVLFVTPVFARNHPLKRHVRKEVTSAARVSDLPAYRQLIMAIMLPLRNESTLTALLQQINTPSSPLYHQFLTPEQFTKEFGPTEQDYQAVVRFAIKQGFFVYKQHTNRILVDITGSTAQIEKAFNVKMGLYKHPVENRNFYSPDVEPSLDLDVPIYRIAGLNNFSIPSRRLIKRSFNAHLSDVVAGSGPSGSFRPSDMRAAYYGSGTLTGTGQSVGMLEFDGYNIADVNSDMGGVAYTVPVQNILVDGASAGSDGDDGEQALDIAQAIGMAPGLTSVRVYIAPGNSAIGTGDVDIFNQMAVDNISKQLSCSWGWSPDDITDDDPIFKEFAAQGQNLFVASGDAGKYTGNNNNDSSYPAEDPYVVAVGGTDLTTNGAGGTWQTETAWSDSSGGPADDGFAIPSWQVGVANSNGASTAIRNVPDVAAEANFDNIMCDDGACTYNQTGGTSYAAPRWAGYMALVNQQNMTNHGTTLGFLNPLIYPIGFGAAYTINFHDITSGSNGHPATVGYDMVTGWGSPNGATLINTLTGAPTGVGLQATYNPTYKTPACTVVSNSCDSGPTLLLGRGNVHNGAEQNHPNTINNSCGDGNSGVFHSYESNDRLAVASVSGGLLTAGTKATITATVWARKDFESDSLDLYVTSNVVNPTWVYIATLKPTKDAQNILSTTFTLPASGNLQAVRAHFRYEGHVNPSACGNSSGGEYDDYDDLVFAVN
jgi:subtilase family serine protease